MRFIRRQLVHAKINITLHRDLGTVVDVFNRFRQLPRKRVLEKLLFCHENVGRTVLEKCSFIPFH